MSPTYLKVILSLLAISLLLVTACNSAPVEPKGESNRQQVQASDQQASVEPKGESNRQQVQASDQQTNPENSDSTDLNLTCINLGQAKDKSNSRLVYIPETETSLQGLALLTGKPEDLAELEFGASCQVQVNLIQESFPPVIDGQISPAEEPVSAVINLDINDLILVRDFIQVQLVDVRTQAEYQAGHLPEASLLPLQAIVEGDRTGLTKDLPLLLYCRSGNRSGQALEILKEEGYPVISNLGGIIDYTGNLVQD